ncbi:MAG TPA: mandelate racemase/muconate lactonizing enzyme family protein [Candidatus Methylomirabilis sp.]|nr:mandelate racemase/muconate lactonizing enzyme family protein [Candidatus Methylomirabilis sp.]
MKITAVETFLLRFPVDPCTYGASSKGWIRDRSSLLVRVKTDAGVEGWGEGGQTGPPELTKVVVDHSLAPLLVGEDPFASTMLWERMYDVTRDYGQKGVVIGAISGADIALWDLKGRALGVPVYALLGGPFRDRVVPYATGMYVKHGRDRADQFRILQDEAKGYAAQGFAAMKMKIGFFSPREDIVLVGAIRDAIGPAIHLAVDANHAYNAYTAIQVGRAIEPHRIAWFEEPVPPEDIQGYLQVKAGVNIPISGGEVEHTSFGARELIARRAVDIIQPDTCGCGGITECWRIAALARAYGVQYFPHVWGSVVGLAASLHLLAALPPCPPTGNPSPYYQEPLLEFDRNPSPLRDNLSTEPIRFEHGVVRVPQGPGLGISINPEVLERYRVA